jgi:hypothetical protein
MTLAYTRYARVTPPQWRGALGAFAPRSQLRLLNDPTTTLRHGPQQEAREPPSLLQYP